MTTLTRETRETRIHLTLGRLAPSAAPPDAGPIATGQPFLDHMLVTLARTSGLSLSLEASGDLVHHVLEDVAIALGEALRAEQPAACARYAHRVIAMDDALVAATLDLGGRAYYAGRLPSRLYEHWMRSFADNARLTLHLRVLRGTDRHHILEAAFKAVGLALRDALVEGEVEFSTKGTVRTQVTSC